MPKASRRAALAALACIVAGGAHAQAPQAQAQAYPSKPIRLLIGTPPGGGTDAIARVLAEKLSALLKQPVVPENRAGAGGVVASEQLAKSAPDGYTLLVAQNGHTTNPAFFRKLPYDTVRDFTPISPLATTPIVLVSSAGSGVKSVKELVETGKRSPGGVSFAAGDSSTRLAVVQLGDAIGVPANVITYKGTGPAATDVAGGHVPFTVTTIASVLPFRATGKLNYLAVLTPERSRFLPDVPTLAEQGVSGVDVRGWWGVFGPANMPPALVEQVHGAIRTVLAMPDVVGRIQAMSAEPWLASPQEFDAFIRKEVPALQQLGRKAGIEPE